MMRYYLKAIIFLLSVHTLSAQFSVTGGIGAPYLYTDGLSNTNIEKIYVLNTLSNAGISYTTSASVVRFYKYTQSESDKVPIASSDISSTGTANTTTYTIRNLEDSKGYFAEVDGKSTSAIWIIDYSRHYPILNSIEVFEAEDKCENLKLLIDKSDDIFFYTTGGTRHRLIRKYGIEYDNMQWNGQSKQFVNKPEKKESLDIGTDYVIDAPLKDTQFKLSGDQFAKSFGLDFSILSKPYSAVAVEAHIVSEQLTETQTQDNTTSEIEAPAEFQFYGVGNEPTAYYYTWYIYKMPDLDNHIVRYTDRDIRYTFKESGEYRVKLEVSEHNSACPPQSDSISIQTSTSFLDVPNFLLLDGEHTFRVTYKSLSNFKCTIFNRWGNKIYEFSDPSQGWDGRYNGKYVSPGVYFYVIQAKGADGKDWKKAADINVLRPR